MSIHRILFTVTLVLLLTVGFGISQETQDLLSLSLEDLLNMEVTTASKKAEKLSDAPGVVSVITAKEIRAFGAQTLVDVLQMSPGIMNVGSHLYPQNVSVIRGDLLTHADNHVLILLNGRPMREGVQGGINNPIYTSFPVDMIDRVEIVRGPGSVLYGSNAFAGVINIITIKAPEESTIKASVVLGSLGTQRGSLVAGTQKGDLKVLIGAQMFKEDGWDYDVTTVHPAPTLGNITKSVQWAENKLGLNAELEYKNLHLSTFYSHGTENTLGTLPYWTFTGENVIDRLFVDLGYTHALSESWNANVNVTHNMIDLVLADGAVEGKSPHYSSDYLGELTIDGSLAENLDIIFGGVIDVRRCPEVPTGSNLDVTYSQKHFSGYTQLNYKPMESLKLIAGAQVNKPDEGDVDVVPRLGAIYYATQSLGIKVLNGSAFRSPWPIEQLLVHPVLLGSKEIGPEKIQTTDVQVFYSVKKLETSLTVFKSEYSDLIYRIPIAPGSATQTFTNGNKMSIQGVEFEGKAQLTPTLFVTGSATYQDNQDDKTLVPTTMVKVGLAYDSPKGISAGVFNTFISDPIDNNGASVNEAAEAISLLSAKVAYKLPTSVPVQLMVQGMNLLDKTYYFPEFSKGWVNTLPISSGRVILGGVSVSM